MTQSFALPPGRTPPQLHIRAGSFLSPHPLDVGSGYSSEAALPADTERNPLMSANDTRVEVTTENWDCTLIVNVMPVVPPEVCDKGCVFSC